MRFLVRILSFSCKKWAFPSPGNSNLLCSGWKKPKTSHERVCSPATPTVCWTCSPTLPNTAVGWNRLNSAILMPPRPALLQCPNEERGQFCIDFRHNHVPRLVITDPCCSGPQTHNCASPWSQVASLATHFWLFLHTLEFPVLPPFIVPTSFLFLFYFSKMYLGLIVEPNVCECLWSSQE